MRLMFSFFPSPALPGSGILGMISARYFKAPPLLKFFCKDNMRIRHFKKKSILGFLLQALSIKHQALKNADNKVHFKINT